MSNDLERREYKRKEKPYRARFKIRSDEAQGMWSYDWDSVFLMNIFLMNISAGGVAFSCNKDLGSGTLLDLKIYVPNSALIINCVGKVTRIDKPRHTSMFGITIKFTEIGEQEKEIIDTTIEKALE